MRFFLLFLPLLLFFTACSNKNAFDAFGMDTEQERSVLSLQSSKIVTKSQEIKGVFSVVYLNEVYPKSFDKNEYFFLFLFTKEAVDIYDPHNPSDNTLKITLNKELPIKVEKLPQENRFSSLVESKNKWNRYYLITFKEARKIELSLEGKDAFSTIITYKKE